MNTTANTPKNQKKAAVSLIDELLAIHDGTCVYCAKGLAHPTHSRCKKNPSPAAMTFKVA